MSVLIITVALALVVSFYCSLMEAVLLSVNPLRLRRRGSDGPHHAERWLELKRNIERPIAAILILNTIARTGGAVLAGVAFVAEFGSRWSWLFALGFMLAVLPGTEILPKVIGVRFNLALARVLGGSFVLLTRVFRPLVRFSDGFTSLVRRGVRAGGKEGLSDVDVLDIVTLAQTARAEQLIHSQEELIIIHAATLSARRVAAVMVARGDVKFFRLDQSFAQNLQRLAGCPFSRFPVSADGSPDGIAWMLHSKNLLDLAAQPEQSAGPAHLEPLPTVAPTETLTQAMCTMLEGGVKIAQVRGADGRFAGLLALNDITQVLVGRR